MFFIYVVGVPSMYVTLFIQSQSELSMFKPISVKKIVYGDAKVEEILKLKEFYASDVTFGKGPDAKVVAMLQEVYAGLGPSQAGDGALMTLKRHYADKADR